MRDTLPLLCALSGSRWVCVSLHRPVFHILPKIVPSLARRQIMKLSLRYDNTFQEVEIELREMEGWLNISVESDESIEDREKRVQEAVNVLLNRPDYNNWHTMARHRGIPPKPSRKDDQDADDTDGLDCLEDTGYARWLEKRESYDAVCSDVKMALANKPQWAEAVISVYIDGENIPDYAKRIGENENNISQKLKRAKKKLKNFFHDRQISPSLRANK